MAQIIKEEFVQKARLANKTSRYDDMASAMESAIKTGVELNEEERNLFLVAYNTVVSARIRSWKVLSLILSSTAQATAGPERINHQITEKYQRRILKELTEICYGALYLLDIFLIPKTNTYESKVFYVTMRANYFRNIATFTDNKNAKMYIVESSKGAYQDAFDIAHDTAMESIHPIRLRLAHNFSTFYYDVLKSPDEACQLAKQAYDDAMAERVNHGSFSAEQKTLIQQLQDVMFVTKLGCNETTFLETQVTSETSDSSLSC